jgi:hypothetical protein
MALGVGTTVDRRYTFPAACTRDTITEQSCYKQIESVLCMLQLQLKLQYVVQCSVVWCNLYNDTNVAVPGSGGYSEGDERGPGGSGEVEGVRLVQMSVA